MKNIPTKIYLQLGDCIENVEDFKELDEQSITWCEDKLFPNDLEYISVLEAKSLVAKALKILKSKAIELYYDNEADADIDNLIRNIDAKEIINEIFPKP